MEDDGVSPARFAWPTLVAWMVILALVGLVVVRNSQREAGDSAARVVSLQMQARYLVGVNRLFPGVSPNQLYEQAEKLIDPADYSQRIRLAILTGEFYGPREAVESLRALEKERLANTIAARKQSIEAVAMLLRLYQSYEDDPNNPQYLDEEQETALRAGLGWFGELALAPASGDPNARSRALAPAYRTVITNMCVALGGLAALCIGGFLLVLVALLLYQGRLAGGLHIEAGHGGVYAETFALYMVVFLGLGFLVSLLPLSWKGLWLSGLVMLVSLVVLGWPLLRGVTWQQVKEDVGLQAGKHPLAEVLFGVGTYLCAVPVLLCGVGMMLLLAYLARKLGLQDPMPAGGPSHPVVGVALRSGWWIWVQLFLVAGICAPVVEEIMFRGVLYRHLREASLRSSRVWSVVLSGLVTSILFAGIHPQGLLAVPALAGLAFVFALAREYRQSLLPAILAHGINNSLISLILLLMA
jgi:membrane protease YdiL (CAAX protease family)